MPRSLGPGRLRQLLELPCPDGGEQRFIRSVSPNHGHSTAAILNADCEWSRRHGQVLSLEGAVAASVAVAAAVLANQPQLNTIVNAQRDVSGSIRAPSR